MSADQSEKPGFLLARRWYLPCRSLANEAGYYTKAKKPGFCLTPEDQQDSSLTGAGNQGTL